MEKTINKTPRERTVAEIERRDRILNIIKSTILFIFIAVAALIIFIPFYWMVNISMQTQDDINTIPPLFFSKHYFQSFNTMFAWYKDNYVGAMTNAKTISRIDFGLLFKNTLIVGVATTMMTIVTTVLASYAFARLKFKGRELIFMLLLATMMVPGEMMTITNYTTIVVNMRGENQYFSLILPFGVSVFYIFFLRQSIKQIPEQLYQAAKVDGVGEFKFLTRVVVPISKPTIITITIMGVIGAWNAYVWPSLVITDNNMRLISDGLKNAFTSDTGRVQSNLQMAASAIVTLPLLAVFILLKKYIVKGISRSGIKG